MFTEGYFITTKMEALIMLKKVFAMSTTVVLAAVYYNWLERRNQAQVKMKIRKKGYVPKTLNVQFVPSQNADTLEAKAKPLEKPLSDKLNIPVKVSISDELQYNCRSDGI